MSSKPRMSAPIGRLQIRTSARRRSASSVGRLQAAEPPCDAELTDEGEARQDHTVPRFYPFAPRLVDDCDD